MNQSINLNLIPDGVKPVAKVSQFDVGRVVTFSLYQGPDVYTPPAGTALEFRELKSDKHICVYDNAATLSGSTITLETTRQMTAAAGEALCQFQLQRNGTVLATLNFWLDVQTDPAAAGDISDSDIPGIIALATEQMERAEAAADSAAADADSAADSKEDAETAATSADASATAAEGSAEDAEAYAIGTRGGTDVPSTDPAYHNNSKYYSDLAAVWGAHTPYIGANGNWYIFDTTTGQYVDSGVDASITVQVADITMLPTNETPYVTNTGSSTDPIFHLFIPIGVGIASIEKTGTSGLVDTYTITYTDQTTDTFTVTNGEDGRGVVSIAKTATSGLVDTYTITYTDQTTSTFNVTNGEDGSDGTDGEDGRGIVSITKTATAGLVDTYTITYTDGTASTFNVTNGQDGAGSVQTVNNIQPIQGNVTLNLPDIADVNTTNLTSGQILVYNSTSQEWENADQNNGGHIVENPAGQNMPERSGLQFTGGVTVSDDSTNDRTVIDLPIEMLGASALTPGARGLVPAPSAGDENKVLKGNGTWGMVSGGHTIVDENGISYPQRSNLKITNATITDDAANDTTLVDITGGGGTTIVQKPTVTVGTYTYDGTAQGPTITGLDTEHCTVANATKTDAGTYTLTISLKNTSTMVWSDLTTADITAEYTIAKKSVTIPTVSGSFTYDGTEKTATIGNTGDSSYWTQGGTASATNAGTYTVTFDLNDLVNTKWSDDTTAQKSGTWTIAKASGSVTLSKNSIILSGNITSDTVAISNATGAISIASSDTTVAIVSPNTMDASGGTLTVTSPDKKSGTATITVSVEATANYDAASTTISFAGNYIVIYGAQWDGTSTTAWARTDGASSFIDPVPAVNSNSGSSPFDTIAPWSEMVKETRNGNVMVKIPKFYYKITQNGSGMKIQISSSSFDGSSVSPAHMDRGDGAGIRDYVYVGRYHCNSSYKSASGSTPVNNITRSGARTSIHNTGTNIWQMDFATRFTIWLLYIVEFADWNSQAKIGYGCGNNSSVENMGYTDSMTYHTGTTQAARTTYGCGTQYRWIEGLWDNVRDWLDGCYYNSSGLNIILNPSNFSDSSGGTAVGVPSSGYPSAFTVENVSGTFPCFIPTAASGSDSTYSCDNWYFSASYPCLYCGGNYDQSQNFGLFYVYYDSATYKNACLGCRLLELP